jgi:hypothetical protein
MRPVLRGIIRYESLIDGTLSLFDLSEINDALDVADENERRIRAAEAKNHG